jgi:hypothetical protein
MKTQTAEEVVYEINVDDLQDVSMQVLGRPLTDAEVGLVKGSVGKHIDWFQAIENAIHEHIVE